MIGKRDESGVQGENVLGEGGVRSGGCGKGDGCFRGLGKLARARKEKNLDLSRGGAHWRRAEAEGRASIGLVWCSGGGGCARQILLG